jgi:hypothetical protein
MTPTCAAAYSRHHPRVSGAGPSTQIGLPVRTNLPPLFTFQQLRDGVRHRFDRLYALEIEYDFEFQDLTQNVDRCRVGTCRAVPYGETHFAFSGPKRFKAQSIIESDGSYIYPSHIWAWDGEVQQNVQCIVKDSYNAYIENEQDHWTESDIYLANVGVPVG